MTPKFEQEAPLTTGLHSLNESDYLHSVRAGLVVPLLQSVTIGMLVTIIASLILEYNGISGWFRWAALVGLSTILAFFLNGLRLWRYLVQLVERELHVDIDRDGEIGEPVRTVKVHVTQGNTTRRSELPFADRLPEFASGLLQGKPLTYAVWVSNQSAYKLFSAGEFRRLIEVMLDEGYIEQINPRDVSRGYKLSEVGIQVVPRLADTSPLSD